MVSDILRFVSLANFSKRKYASLAVIGGASFLLLISSAWAQSQTRNYRSYSSSHYRSAGHIQNSQKKPSSLPPSAVQDVVGKPSERNAMSSSKELDKLERASIVKSSNGKRALLRGAGASKGGMVPEQHSAPINFSHKELPQGHSGASKSR